MPGDDFYSGFWPAIWMLGNLGRAGMLDEVYGLWTVSAVWHDWLVVLI